MSRPASYLDGRVMLHPGDCLDVLRGLADASIDSCVTDPPYALVSIAKRFGKAGAVAPRVPEGGSGVYSRASAGFMGKTWDTGERAFAVEFWAEVLRVLKPGGHVVAFSGTRTYHRLACAIEDAGFEIRDQLAWVYGNGFPKSHDVSKGIDRHNGDERPVVGRELVSNDVRGGALLDVAHSTARPALERDVTTAASAGWQGWGTALKPAWEPIVLARKPLSGTVAETVLRHGTGALNIDGCRDDDGEIRRTSTGGMARKASPVLGTFNGPPATATATTIGRWPANIVHDGAEPALRYFYSAKADVEDRVGSKHPTIKPVDLMQWLVRLVTPPRVLECPQCDRLAYGDCSSETSPDSFVRGVSGSVQAQGQRTCGEVLQPSVRGAGAAASAGELGTNAQVGPRQDQSAQAERHLLSALPGEDHHEPACSRCGHRLEYRPGRVLDPFAGTGTTGEAAWREGFAAVLVEREAEYQADIARRMELAVSGRGERRRKAAKAHGLGPDLGPLFGDPGLSGGGGGSTAASPIRPDDRADRPQAMRG